MARNYPECHFFFNSTYLEEEARQQNLTEQEVVEAHAEWHGNCTYAVFDYKSDAYVYSLIACYSVILPIGFFGNLAVVLTVLTVNELRIVVNLLLVALSLSDLIMTIAVPFTLLHNISYNYEGSVGICRITPLIQGTAVMSGIYTLVLIAIERFNAIVHPHRQRILNSASRVAICIGAIWLVSMCFQMPLPIVMDVVTDNYLLDSNLTEVQNCSEVCSNITTRECVETWSLSQALGFSYAVLVTLYVVPLICITYLYSRMGYKLWKLRPIGVTSQHEVSSYKRKKRLITFLVVLVVTFAVMWGPYFILQCFLGIVNNPIVPGVLQIMGHANVAVNPILYAYFHRKIRKHALAYLHKVGSLCRSSNSNDHKTAEEKKRPSSVQQTSHVRHTEIAEIRHERTSMQFTDRVAETSTSGKSSTSFTYAELILRISDLRRQSQTLGANPGTHMKLENTVNCTTTGFSSRAITESTKLVLPNSIEKENSENNSNDHITS